MTPAQWKWLKQSAGSFKRWGMFAHRKKQYAKRDALFSRHDEATLRLYRTGKP